MKLGHSSVLLYTAQNQFVSDHSVALSKQPCLYAYQFQFPGAVGRSDKRTNTLPGVVFQKRHLVIKDFVKRCKVLYN